MYMWPVYNLSPTPCTCVMLSFQSFTVTIHRPQSVRFQSLNNTITGLMVSRDDGVSPLALAVEKEKLDAVKYLVAEFKLDPEGKYSCHIHGHHNIHYCID